MFSIAATLLVLDLAVHPPGTPLQQVLRAWPGYLAYVVSFLTIGGAWLALSFVFFPLGFLGGIIAIVLGIIAITRGRTKGATNPGQTGAGIACGVPVGAVQQVSVTLIRADGLDEQPLPVIRDRHEWSRALRFNARRKHRTDRQAD